MSTTAIKVSAADLRDLPAPTDPAAVAQAAGLLSDLDDPGARMTYRSLMHQAYGLSDNGAEQWELTICAYLDRAAV